MIVAVAGLPGIGKTTWIKKRIAALDKPVRYFSAGEGNIIVDRTYLSAKFPHLEIIDEHNIQQLLSPEAQNITTYIELNWSLDLEKINPFFQQLQCHRIALIAASMDNSYWADWADESIICSSWDSCDNLNDIFQINSPQMHRLLLTGEIVDLPSLEVFWYELTEGAYGELIRAKGIFNLVDGQTILGNYMLSLPRDNFTSLSLPHNLDRNRFSGVEIFGKSLDNESIIRTIEDCCLADTAINYYQEQLQIVV
jgi:hypothetical protein